MRNKIILSIVAIIVVWALAFGIAVTCNEANATAIISLGEDQYGAVGDTVFAEVMFAVIVPQDSIRLFRLNITYDKTVLKALHTFQGRDAPGIWLFQNNFLGFDCADYVVLGDHYDPIPSWEGHAMTLAFEVLVLEETVVGFCRYGSSGDNQLFLRHDGVTGCTAAWKPWMYSDLQDGYDCVQRLISNDVLVVNPESSSTVAVEATTWATIKGMYR